MREGLKRMMEDIPSDRAVVSAEMSDYIEALEEEVERLEARIVELETIVYPQNSIPLEDLFTPLKPCPFCGSLDLFNDDGMAIICKHCDATAPVTMWQFRAKEV